MAWCDNNCVVVGVELYTLIPRHRSVQLWVLGDPTQNGAVFDLLASNFFCCCANQVVVEYIAAHDRRLYNIRFFYTRDTDTAGASHKCV